MAIRGSISEAISYPWAVPPQEGAFVKPTSPWPRKVRTGDFVRLNNVGLDACFGTSYCAAHLKADLHTITRVAINSCTSPEITFTVEVADPVLNRFHLKDTYFDLVQDPTAPYFTLSEIPPC